MSKELFELSELYSQIAEQVGGLPSNYKETEKAARELESKHNEKSGKNLDKRARVTVDGKTYYEGEPGYDAAMKKAGPDEATSPQGVVQKDKDKQALEAGAVERKDSDADPVDGPKMSTADRIAMAKANAKKVSPASIKTNQRQTREIIKQQSKSAYPTLEKGDLNQFNRTKTYTADDGKTQVDRSTVFTKAKMDFGNIKKGQPLGVLTRSQRKQYDLKAAGLNNSSSNVKINPSISEEFDAYDLVLSYLMETNQVESLEEANYVMMEMDGKTINEIRQLAEGMPQYVRDSIGRQYGTGKYKGEKYTIEDKKNVINWYSRIKA